MRIHELPRSIIERSLSCPRWGLQRRTFTVSLAAFVLAFAGSQRAVAQSDTSDAAPLPSIAEKTSGMEELDGLFPLYWDADLGRLWMEIPYFDTEVLHVNGLAAGLGSNDIGLGRGQLQGSRIVEFERVGRKILMVQPNYRFRATTDNPAEVRAVADAFARSVLWGFTAAAETDGRVLVDVTEYLIRDPNNIANRLRPGDYRLDTSRSSIYMPMTKGFPRNTEMEVELTFVAEPAEPRAGGPGPVAGPASNQFFEGVDDVAATGQAASLRAHYSFVELPGPGYRPRRYDPRAGYSALTYEDYAVPLGEPLTQRFIRRHRLEKADPEAPVSAAIEPIVYYLDPGTPEPIRSALLEGAGWWNQAFEAAGYRDAFRVELLPEGASALDIRYNVINWVHRSTRGWSSGAGVTDPRTGEILKGVVTLGSLRIRQDYMLAEGLLAPYENGDETPPELAEWALARIRQLSAHEVGHTLGLGHNYYDSEAGRISVMDYPHPLIALTPEGELDYSAVYEDEIGEWDEVAIDYGYREFPSGVDEVQALRDILALAWERDVLYLSNQDIDAHPRADQWSNGTNAAAELDRLVAIRRVALARFGENSIKRGMPLATMEEVLVPLYLHHRYQVEAAASVLGGVDYIYAFRGDGRKPFQMAAAEEQYAALDALMATLSPAELALPPELIAQIPPRPAGFGRHRELFPRYTGGMFDVITPATVAAEHTLGNILEPERAARLVKQHALNASLPGLETVLDELTATAFGADPVTPYEAEVGRAVQRVLVERLLALSAGAGMPQVRATAGLKLERLREDLQQRIRRADDADAAHFRLLAQDISRSAEQAAPSGSPPTGVESPPGAPIGEPPMRWLEFLDPPH